MRSPLQLLGFAWPRLELWALQDGRRCSSEPGGPQGTASLIHFRVAPSEPRCLGGSPAPSCPNSRASPAVPGQASPQGFLLLWVPLQALLPSA